MSTLTIPVVRIKIPSQVKNSNVCDPLQQSYLVINFFYNNNNNDNKKVNWLSS